MIVDKLGFFDATRHERYRGPGFIAGLAPTSSDPGNPDSIDGRFRIQNVPSRGRVVVLDRNSLEPVASTLSATDGTYRIDWLSPASEFLVLGFDDRSNGQNAAVQDRVLPVAMP